MPDKETLQKIIADPHSSDEERSEAKRLLDAEPSTEHRLRLTGIAAMEDPERALLRFAGVTTLEDVTPNAVMRFAATQPQPLPDAIKNLLGLWRCFRWQVTDEVWQDINERYPMPERRAAFERLIAEHPYLGDHDKVRREELRHLEGLCSQNDDYTVRTYFLPRVEEFVSRLPEHAFTIREAAQELLAKYKSSGEIK
jgi:hypothetical protein